MKPSDKQSRTAGGTIEKTNKRKVFVKKIYKPVKALTLLMISVAIAVLAGCNKEEDPTLHTVNMNVPAVAVTNFYLRPDTKVLANLDSVFFSIDLENGVIFNADSLPKGTNVEKLIPVITFSSTVETATIEMTGGNVRTGSVDYKKNPTDSIDFSGRVQLTLTSTDDLSRTYELRVNVHKAAPDSLTWGEMAYAKLPSRMASPRRQRTLSGQNNIWSVIEESDGSYTLASTSDLFEYVWNKRQVSLPAGGRLETLALADGKFYILDTDGRLFSALPQDMNWSDTGERWVSMTGVYDEHVLGIALKDGKLMHTHYPAGGGIANPEMQPGFPVRNQTPMQTIENSWSNEPTAFLFGGEMADGQLSSAVWAFDGENWIEIANGGIPALSGAILCPYYTYRKTSTSWIQTEYRTWLLFGGRKADGTLNHTLYISYDSGVTWREGSSQLQLPDFIPALTGGDCIVGSIRFESDLANAWTRAIAPKTGIKRVAYEVDGYNISWACPYIFIFGGEMTDGTLNDNVWRGVLERLRFTPLI